MVFQFGAAVLDTCVLAVLSRGDTYGYVLTQLVRGVLDISESTLYPVLRRLQKEGLLTAYDQPFQGRNRRYYAITARGKDRFEEYQNEWKLYKSRIDHILMPVETEITPNILLLDTSRQEENQSE